MATSGVLCGGGPAKLRATRCVALYRDPADLLKNYDASPLSARGARSASSGNRGNNNKEKSMSSDKTFYFLTGLGIGVAAGILYAPKSGNETRDFLKSTASYAKKTATDVIDLAKQKADELKKTAAETIDDATQTEKLRWRT